MTRVRFVKQEKKRRRSHREKEGGKTFFYGNRDSRKGVRTGKGKIGTKSAPPSRPSGDESQEGKRNPGRTSKLVPGPKKSNKPLEGGGRKVLSGKKKEEIAISKTSAPGRF